EGAGSRQRWDVPVMVRSRSAGGEQHRQAILSGGSAQVDFDEPIEWAVVNEGGHGFYRTRYGGGLLRRLAQEQAQLETVERFNLVSDTWAATVAGLSPVADFFDLVKLFQEETDP